MRQNRRYTFLIHLVLVTYLVTGLVDFNKVVLCFGDDGHVAVERATMDGRCETAPASTPMAPTWQDVDISSLCHCGPCIDVALATIDARPTPVLPLQDGAPQLQLLALSLPSFLLLYEPPPTKRQPTFIPPPAVSALTSLRTVILLI